MKQVVFFILGVLTVLALGAFQAPPAPVSYRMFGSERGEEVLEEMNKSAREGCRLTQFNVHFSGAYIAVMECPAEIGG